MSQLGIGNENEIRVEGKGGVQQTTKVTHHGNVHREVVTTRENGRKTVHITEVRVARPTDVAGGQDMMMMGMPQIIIGRPRNLKMNQGNAAPFKIFQSIDEVFEDMFRSLADSMIEEQLEALNEINDEIKKVDEVLSQDVKVTEVKDITEEIKNNNKLEEDKDLVVTEEKVNRESDSVEKIPQGVAVEQIAHPSQ